MTRVRDFVADLARAGQNYKEIRETVNKVYGGMSLRRSAIYEILRKVKAGQSTEDQRRFNAKKKTVRTQKVVAALAEAIKADNSLSVRQLAVGCRYCVSDASVHKILRHDLGLVKKSDHWVPGKKSPKAAAARKTRKSD
jgi:hypothetical protein